MKDTEIQPYKKGDEFWWIYTDTLYRGGVHPPRIRHGVVTGGGEIMIRYLVDGDRGNSSERRNRFEARVSRTREEAVAKALVKYETIHEAAAKTMNQAAAAIAHLRTSS